MSAVLAFAIREQIALREHRDRHFGPGLFADPAWDILLDLALARINGRRISVTSAARASRVPLTTALRWLTVLTDAGLTERTPHPDDARSAFIGITDDGYLRIEAALSTIATVRAA